MLTEVVEVSTQSFKISLSEFIIPLFSHYGMLYKNIKIKKYKTIILPRFVQVSVKPSISQH